MWEEGLVRLGAEGPEGRDGATLSMDFKTGNLQVCPGRLLAPGRGARMSTLPTSRSPESETSEQKAVRKGLVQRGHWHILFPSALLTPAVLQSEPLTSPEDKKGSKSPVTHAHWTVKDCGACSNIKPRYFYIPITQLLPWAPSH